MPPGRALMCGTGRGVLLEAAASTAVAAQLLSLSGLFAVYKSKGPTSASVLNQLKAKLLAEAGLLNPGMKRRPPHYLKIGHGGILDSAAAGVLVVGIGKGTKKLGSMLAGSKKYTAVGELGKATDTFDSTGKVTEEKPYDGITQEDLEHVLQKFTGSIMQAPPLYSALKMGGQRLSTLVKEGIIVEAKPPRPVVVYSLALKNFKPPLFTLGGVHYASASFSLSGVEMAVKSKLMDMNPRESSCKLDKDLYAVTLKRADCSFTFLCKVDFCATLAIYHLTVAIPDVECGGGFYVRSLVNDIGKELSSCATVQELTRTKQGPFTLEEHALYEDKWTVDEIAQSLERCMPLLPAESSRKKLKTGLPEEHTVSCEDK
ncbi:hypothetical protein lerEdw1_007879 [Lerista edwardsae]|nr:hypothetical protein lerEdw1_007879 [Lerista edwardsae]